MIVTVILLGYELKNQLRNISLYTDEIQNVNLDAIDSYIFRDYVYSYEKIDGLTRECALRKAFYKYKMNYNIKNN